MTAAAAFDVELVGARVIGADIKALEFARPDRAPLPAFQPGAHVMVWIPAADGSTIERRYSLTGDPLDAGGYAIAVLRQGRGSVALHGLAAGARLRISAPRNEFSLAQEARRHVLVAGGIGVTPIVSFARALAAASADFEVHYAARRGDRFAFREPLAAWAEDRLRLYDASKGEHLEAHEVVAQAGSNGAVYVCGPRPLIEAVRSAAATQSLPREAVRFESFGDAAQRRAIEVTLARSGRRIVVPPELSILEAVEQEGIMHSFDCRRGECGSCLTRVLAGEADHRDVCQTAEERAEGGFMTICVSRALGDALTLDV